MFKSEICLIWAAPSDMNNTIADLSTCSQLGL